MDCFSCHSKEFGSVSNPSHVAAGFPKTCETCHTTTTWVGAQGSLTSFRSIAAVITESGRRAMTAIRTPANYAVFSCINCHAHDKPSMDSEHRSIRGYAYDSATCYSCHPTGRN